MEKNALRCLKIRNETATTADLYIHGDITDDVYKGWLSDWDGNTDPGYVLPTDIREQLKALDGKTLNVYINSDGGSVAAGVAIANMIARHRGKTVGIIDGWAASVASVIFMACDELHMPSNTFLMIHKPAVSVSGNSDDLLKAAEVLDTIQDGIEKTYLAKAKPGVTPDDIHDAVNAETWYTAAEAAEVFDVVVDDTEIQLTACSTRVTNRMPEAIKAVKIAAKTAENEGEKQENNLRRRKIACELELLR